MTVEVIPAKRPTEIEPLDVTLKEIFGSPPLLKSESREEYDAFYNRLRAAVVPRDLIEEIWVRDVADLTWEILRLRRLKSAFMNASAHKGLEQILSDLGVDWLERGQLVSLWIKGDPETTETVDDLLNQSEIDGQNIEARTLASQLKYFERMDRLVAQAEVRRNNVLREVDRHRDAAAKRLRDEAANIEDVEFEDVSKPARKAAP